VDLVGVHHLEVILELVGTIRRTLAMLQADRVLADTP
jgi:hypothetical protein